MHKLNRGSFGRVENLAAQLGLFISCSCIVQVHLAQSLTAMTVPLVLALNESSQYSDEPESETEDDETPRERLAKLQKAQQLINGTIEKVSKSEQSAEESAITQQIDQQELIRKLTVQENSRGSLAATSGLVMPWEVAPGRSLFGNFSAYTRRPVSEQTEAIVRKLENQQLADMAKVIEELRRKRLALWIGRTWGMLTPEEQSFCRKYAKDFSAEASGENAIEEADLSKQIQSSPDRFDHYLARSKLRERRNDLKGALADLTLCIDKKFGDREAELWSRAQIYHALGETKAMFVDLNEVIKMEGPNASSALVLKGKQALVSGRIMEAQLCAYEAVDKYPSTPGAHDLMAQVYSTHRMRTKAIESLEKVVQLAPDDANANYRLGNLLAKEDRNKEALECYSRSVESDPYWWRPLSARATMRTRTNDWEGALADLTKAAEVAPTEPTIFRSRAAVYKHLGKEAEAISDTEKEVELKLLNP